MATVESIAIGLLLPAIGWVVDRRDPFFLSHPFSWCVVPPLMAGLRYGFAAASASAIVLGTAVLMAWRLRVFGAAALPGEAVIGMFIVAMVAGHFSDVWLRETVRAQRTSEHAKRRASEIARVHFLLQLSHERLQEQSPGVASLREALDRIGEARGRARGADWPAIAQDVMALASRFASVETASLVRTDASGTIGAVLAVLGEAGTVPPRDPLVLEAVRTREIVCAASGGSISTGTRTRTPHASAYLAVVPVVDSSGALHGLLCVEGMPFYAFTRRNLEAVAALVGHLADRVSAGVQLGDPHGERASAFLQRVDQAINECRERGVPAVLGILAVVAGSPLGAITDLVLSGILGTKDAVHRAKGRTGDVLIWLLLPGATEAEVATTVARIEDLTRQELDRSLAEAGGTAAFRLLTAADSRRSAMAELQRGVEARRGHR